MKTTHHNFRNVFLALATSVCAFSGAMAYDNYEQDILNSDPIDVNGYVHERAQVSDHELESVKNELRKQQQTITINKEKGKKYKELSRTTEKLADVTEEYIEERKESQETIDRFNKKIECLMQENKNDPECDKYVQRRDLPSDEVSLKHAAVQKSQAQADTELKGGDIKVLPFAGFSSIMSQNENLEAGVSAGVRVESNITNDFSVGVGFGYTSLETTDFANAFRGMYNSSYQFQRSYTNYYNGGREVEYSNMAFELYSKYFITKTERFRPYVGAGLSYNRSSMSYLDNRSQQIPYQNGMNTYQAQFGNEEVTSGHIKAQIIGGSEIYFTKNIGLNIELQYSRGLGGNLSSESAMTGPDQRRLEALNDELIEANMFSAFAGMLITF